MRKFFLALVAIVLSALAAASGTITVISPSDGDYLGANNTMSFSITGAVTAVTVTAVLTGPGGVTVQNSGVFTNIVNNQVTGNLALNLNRSLPEGAYVLQVTANEANNTYNTPSPINVTVVLTAPKMLDFNPLNGAYVKGVVPISASVLTSYIKDWKVQVNGQDIPNNSGTSTSFSVNWDTSTILTDGPQTITITVRDLGLNTLTQTINVTLDRLPPTITVQFPRADTPVTLRSQIPVIVDVKDENSQAISQNAIDVIVTDMNHNFLRRVTRVSVSSTGSTTLRWIGRLQPWVSLPNQFILQATAVNKAGTIGQQQQIVVTGN